MTADQLAKRLKITRQAINDAERREITGEISLAQLRRLAAALDCELVYAIVPRTSLAKTVDARAESIARAEVAKVAHTMALEAQEPDPTLKSDQVQQFKRQLLDKRWSRLWR